MLTQSPGTAFAIGQFNRVPVITGSNHDEYRLFVAIAYDYAGQPLTDSQYPTAIAEWRLGIARSSTDQYDLGAQFQTLGATREASVIEGHQALAARATRPMQGVSKVQSASV